MVVSVVDVVIEVVIGAIAVALTQTADVPNVARPAVQVCASVL